MSTDISIAPVKTLAKYFEPLLDEYEEVEAGVHFIHYIGSADGEHLKSLFEEDNPDIFSDILDDDARCSMLQDILDSIDSSEPQEGIFGRQVEGLWTTRDNEMWAGADQEYFERLDYLWRRSVVSIKTKQRFVRPLSDGQSDPSTYLTPDTLKILCVRIKKGAKLYRAAIGGIRDDGGKMLPFDSDRMKGPKPEHCRRGGRLNPAGIPILYCDKGSDGACGSWCG